MNSGNLGVGSGAEPCHKILNIRPSDRVRGCGNAQFDQTRMIMHNPRKFAKSFTRRKCLLEILIKAGISIEYQDF